MHDLNELSKLAIELATSAGDILRKGRAEGFGKVDTKSSSVDIVTEIDKASEAYIVSVLKERRPDDGILGEEGASIEGTSGVHWVVDPLDGTVNFTYGYPVFAVSVGVEVDGERVIGAVYNPMTDELFTAITGQGAYLNGERISVRQENVPAQSLVGTGFSYDADSRAQQAQVVLELLPKVRDIRRDGSAALDLCALACGRIDAYYERGVWPWDVTAGDVIATEAGARVTALTGGGTATRTIFAANPALHEALLPLVAK